MLARGFRLKKAGDFARVYKHGRSASASDLFIKAVRTGYGVSRLAVVVSKKVSKKAVVRNKIKRKCTEVARKNWNRLRPGYNIVVTIKADISTLDEAAISAQIFKCLERLGVADAKGKR